MSAYADLVDTHNIVQVYLMSCHLYEHKNLQVLDDGEFDAVCQWLDDIWDEIDHPHKEVIDREALSSATASYLKESDIPNLIKGAAMHWYKSYGVGTPPEEDDTEEQMNALGRAFERVKKAASKSAGCRMAAEEVEALWKCFGDS